MFFLLPVKHTFINEDVVMHIASPQVMKQCQHSLTEGESRYVQDATF